MIDLYEVQELEENIALTELQAKIIELIGVGHNNATQLNDLALRIGKNERSIRFAIEDLRRQGYAILIPKRKPFGYFFPETRLELDDYKSYMRSRAINEYRTYKLVKNATESKFGKLTQLPLF